jgi:hypothetical protein
MSVEEIERNVKVFCIECGKVIYEMENCLISPSVMKKRIKTDRCPYCNRILGDKFTLRWNR